MSLDALARDLDGPARELARRDFWEFFQHMDQKAVLGWWQQDAAGHLGQFYVDLIAGRRPKLAIFAPPQHGKSRLVTDFIAWVAGKNPDLRTIYTSFSQDLGVDANRKLQRIFDSERYQAVFPGTRLFGEQVVTQANKPRRNQSHMEFISRVGSFRNVTTGGPITGKTLDLGIGDDLLKGEEAANSRLMRDKIWDWFTSEFLSRFDDKAGQIQIGTRWHLDDVLGRMIQRIPGIKVLTYCAIAERDEPQRRRGDALFPEWKSLEFLAAQRKVYSPSAWASLYQQNPVPEGGAIVKEAWLGRRYRARGAKPQRVVQSWDCASKPEERNDPSVCLTFAAFADRVELWDVSVARQEFPDLIRRAKDLYAAYRPSAVLIEDKDAGQQMIQLLKRGTTFPVVAINPGTLDKVTRMDAETPFLEAGNLHLPENAPWVHGYVTELITFPAAAHDDQVDATSQFLAWLRRRAVPGGWQLGSITRSETNFAT